MIVIYNGTAKPSKENYWLEIGQPYFVYAVTSLVDSLDDEEYSINISGTSSTYSVPARFFTVLDGSNPSDWEEDEYEAYGNKVRIKTFPEWAHDSSFYEKLWNDDPEALTIFRKYSVQYEKTAKDFAAKHKSEDTEIV